MNDVIIIMHAVDSSLVEIEIDEPDVELCERRYIKCIFGWRRSAQH